MRATGRLGDEAIRAAADFSSINVRTIRDAIGYYNAYPVDIDARIERNEEEADAAERHWREQNLSG